MLTSKLKQARLCLKAGRVTLPYPFEPAPAGKNFRGLPRIQVTRCTGCGACAVVCPPRLIEIIDQGPLVTIIRHFERCIYCGRCAEVCPEKAIEMTGEFETATDDKKDLLHIQHIYMATCSRCGRCFTSRTPLDPPGTDRFREVRLKKLGGGLT